MKRVTEIITTDEVRKWNNGDVIIITAGTGAGKSYFIKNSVYLVAKERKKKILFLIHRKNCVEQFKKEVKKANKQETIEIMTYQKIDKVIKDKKLFGFDEFDYIVCDEFHYFMSDASYNLTTDLSFHAILNTKAIKIYMSATGVNVKRYINRIKKIDTIDYELPIKYEFIKSMEIYHKDSILEDVYIKECLEGNDKAIFFINSAEKAHKLHKKYKESSIFNCSTSHKLYKHVDEDLISGMLENECFKKQILFTTTCMDAGVNICDESVKHIVIDDVLDIGVIKQCIGRKRMQHKKDKVRIYIKNINNNILGGKIKILQDKIKQVKYLEENGVDKFIEKYSRDEQSSMIYDVVGEERKKINLLAFFKAKSDIALFKLMVKEKYGFSSTLKISLNQDYYSVTDEVVKANTLEGYLNSIVGERLDKEAQKELISKIDHTVDGRQLRSYNKLNIGLKMLKLPYVIDSKRVKINNELLTVWLVGKITYENISA